MKAGLHILSKVLIRQFYIAHAGFFLFMFLFFFGIVNAQQLITYHYSLMLAILSSPVILAGVMIAWLIYNIMCILFCTQVIAAPEGRFLLLFRTSSAVRQYLLYLMVSLSHYFPVMIYACILARVALHQQQTAIALYVLAFQLVMLLLHTTMLYYTVNKTKESIVTQFFAWLGSRLHVHKRYFLFLPAFMLHEKKIAMTVSKIFSLLLLSMLFVLNRDSFDKDLFSIFYPFVIMVHATVVMHAVVFNESQFYVQRNMPLHWAKQAFAYLFTWCMLLLPELAFMLINNHGNMPVAIILFQWATAPAMLLLFAGIAMAAALNMERYLLFVFVSYIFLLIVQRWLGAGIALAAVAAMALLVFASHYYSFEKEVS